MYSTENIKYKYNNQLTDWLYCIMILTVSWEVDVTVLMACAVWCTALSENCQIHHHNTTTVVDLPVFGWWFATFFHCSINAIHQRLLRAASPAVIRWRQVTPFIRVTFHHSPVTESEIQSLLSSMWPTTCSLDSNWILALPTSLLKNLASYIVPVISHLCQSCVCVTCCCPISLWNQLWLVELPTPTDQLPSPTAG